MGDFSVTLSALSQSKRFMYQNFWNLFEKKTKTGLNESDVKNVKARDQTINRYAEFEVNWKRELERIKILNEKQKHEKKKSNKVSSEKSDEKSDEITPSLYRVLWATFYHEILITAGWKLANDILTFFSPQIIKQVLAFIDTEPVCPDGLDECEVKAFRSRSKLTFTN